LVCIFIGGGETILEAFYSSALWQIYQTLYLFFRMHKYNPPLRVKECRPLTPQHARMILLSSRGGKYGDVSTFRHLHCFRVS
jgi:hypothetical protein